MVQKADDNGGIAGLVIMGLVIAAGVYSCSDNSNEREAAIPTPIVSETSPASVIIDAVDVPSYASPSPPPPSHNYESVEDGVYYYLAAVSEEDRKKGLRASSALGFRYLGRNEGGEDMVIFVDAGETSYCRRPCKISRWDSGSRIGYDEGSIIGSVYADVSRGYLKKYAPPKPKNLPAEKPFVVDPNLVMDDIEE